MRNEHHESNSKTLLSRENLIQLIFNKNISVPLSQQYNYSSDTLLGSALHCSLFVSDKGVRPSLPVSFLVSVTVGNFNHDTKLDLAARVMVRIK